MQKAALFLSLAALALAGWLLWSTASSGSEVDRLRRDLDALSSLEARVTALEGAPKAAREPPPPATVLGAPPPAAPEAAAAPATGTGSAATARAAAVPVRVAELEKRLAALEEKAAGASAAAPFARPARVAMRGPNGGRLYGSVDDAKEDLDLTDAQKADFERIVADTRREQDELRKLPDDEGKTWEQVQREVFTTEGGAFRFDMTKLESFRKKPVPGRSETFGQADQRIRDAARRRMRDVLSATQQEKFDKAATDPMLGGGQTSFVSVGFVTDIKGSDGK